MGEEPPNAVTVGDSGWEDVLLKMNLFFKMASYTEDRWCWRSPTTVKEWLFQFGLFYASCWTSCPLCPKCAPHFVQKNVCFSLKCRKTHESCPPMLGHFFVERLLSPTPPMYRSLHSSLRGAKFTRLFPWCWSFGYAVYCWGIFLTRFRIEETAWMSYETSSTLQNKSRWMWPTTTQRLNLCN